MNNRKNITGFVFSIILVGIINIVMQIIVKILIDHSTLVEALRSYNIYLILVILLTSTIVVLVVRGIYNKKGGI